MCHSTDHPLGGPAFGGEGEPCPNVFELERIIEERREAAVRLHVNLVNIEFRRSLFEVYCRGAVDGDSGEVDAGGSGGGGGDGGGGVDDHDAPVDLMAIVGNPAAAAAGAGRQGAESGKRDEVFVATHKVSESDCVRDITI